MSNLPPVPARKVPIASQEPQRLSLRDNQPLNFSNNENPIPEAIITSTPPTPPPPPPFVTARVNSNNNKEKEKEKEKKNKKFKLKLKNPFSGIGKDSHSHIPAPPPPPPVLLNITNIAVYSIPLSDSNFYIQLDERNETLLNILATPTAVISKALLSIGLTRNVKFLLKSVVNIYSIGGKTLELVTPFIRDEVAKTEDKATLFRGQEMSPRIISVICSLFGKDFLVKCLEPPFKALQEMLSKELFFEVNPMNVEENLLQQNIENLRTICQIFLDSVLSQREYLPQALKEICRRLRELTKDKFAESKDFVIGGFFFLRFVCPAIVSPQTYGVIETMPTNPAFRRSLVLISKILQNLSNGLQFGKKESYMLPFNEFIISNLPQVGDLFDYFSLEEINPIDQMISLEIDHNLIDDLVCFICQNPEIVISEMLQFTKDIPLLEAEIETVRKFAAKFRT